MAVTVTPVLAGTSRYICDLEADANADVTSGNIPHGLGAVPLSLILTPLQLEYWTSTPFFATYDNTNLVVTMSAGVGSGGAGNQMRIEAQLPHSLTR